MTKRPPDSLWVPRERLETAVASVLVQPQCAPIRKWIGAEQLTSYLWAELERQAGEFEAGFNKAHDDSAEIAPEGLDQWHN